MHRTPTWLGIVACILWPHLSALATWYIGINNDTAGTISYLIEPTAPLEGGDRKTGTLGPGGSTALLPCILNASEGCYISITFPDAVTVTKSLAWWTGAGAGPAWNFYSGNHYDANASVWHTSAPPAKYKTRVDVTNSTDYQRRVKIDTDGDGTWDEEFDLAPNGVFSKTYERDTAPTANGKVLTSGPNGDGSTSYEVAVIPAASWTQNTTPTTTPAVLNPGVSVTPNTSPDGKIGFGTPTGTASESTLQKGFSAVATAVSEAGQSDAAILGKIYSAVEDNENLMRVLTNNTSRAGLDTTGTQAEFNSQKAASRAALDNAFSPIATTLGNHNATAPGAARGSTFGLGTNGRFGVVNWSPSSFAPLLNTLTLLRAFFVWCAWFLFGRHVFEYSRHSILETIKHGRGWQAASAVPIASSGTAITMAAIFTAAITVAAGAIISAALGAVNGLGTWDTLQLSMISSAEWGHVMNLTNMLFPLNTLIGMAFTEVAFRGTCDAITGSTLTASRWLVG